MSINLFALDTHDTPINEIKFITYADNVTFFVRHINFKYETHIAQNHLHDLKKWLENNHIKLAHRPKSSVTVLINLR